MQKLGQLLYTNSWDYKVYGVVMRDINSKRVSLDIYVVSPEGEMSDIITIPRKDIYARKKSALDVLFDLEGQFEREDIDKMKNIVQDIMKSDKNVEMLQNRATLEEIHVAVSNYIRKNAEDLEDNPYAEIFIRDGFGYMVTTKMDEFIKINAELGYKRLEVLKRLKIMGALQTGKNRPYDILVSVKREKRHYYKIELAGIPQEETSDEEVEI